MVDARQLRNKELMAFSLGTDCSKILATNAGYSALMRIELL